jgi:hypothetical protein
VTERDENAAREQMDGATRPVGDLADEAERAWTPQTPARALTGVWLTVVVTVVVVLVVVALALYFVGTD